MDTINQSELTPFQRREMLCGYLKEHRSASVRELARKFYLHEATVRRDLNELEANGLVTRVRGGATYNQGLFAEIPLYVRETEFKEEKKRMAAAAAQLVHDGETIFIDSSSSATLIVPCLTAKKRLRIVTDGVQTCVQLSKLTGAEIYSVGGRLRENSFSLAGSLSERYLSMFHFERAFFSCKGCTVKNGMTDISVEEASFRRILMERSEQSVLLMDHSKLGMDSFFQIGPVSKLGTLITDSDNVDDFRTAGVEVITV